MNAGRTKAAVQLNECQQLIRHVNIGNNICLNWLWMCTSKTCLAIGYMYLHRTCPDLQLWAQKPWAAVSCRGNWVTDEVLKYKATTSSACAARLFMIHSDAKVTPAVHGWVYSQEKELILLYIETAGKTFPTSFAKLCNEKHSNLHMQKVFP